VIQVGAHAAESVFASKIHARFDRDSTRGGECVASVKQSVEANTRAGSAAGRAEFDVAGFHAAFGAGAVEADGEGIERTTGVSEDDVAGALREDGADFAGKIESLIDLIRELRAGSDGLLALSAGQGGEQNGRDGPGPRSRRECGS